MSTIADRAIAWYGRAARDLPWRRPDATAWGVLVSEVMLQQTPVSRVEPVWSTWLARWPTPATLALEPAGEAIRAWGRLGYPRRALRLHSCAGEIVRRFDGVVPADVNDLSGLPGIGSYTARAVSVFAYGQRHPVVDTNVRRLVARAVTGESGGAPATSAYDLTTVARLLPRPPADAARASIAFMELGALVCTARTPVCSGCPLEPVCAWRRRLAFASVPESLAGASGYRSEDRAAGSEVPRSRRAQGYAGSDRQVRGLILAVLRQSRRSVPKSRLDQLWSDDEQRERALSSLLTDGLVVSLSGRYRLP